MDGTTTTTGAVSYLQGQGRSGPQKSMSTVIDLATRSSNRLAALCKPGLAPLVAAGAGALFATAAAAADGLGVDVPLVLGPLGAGEAALDAEEDLQR